jgi:hypothetical protein
MFHQQFCFVFSDLKLIRHENTDSNLESPYIFFPLPAFLTKKKALHHHFLPNFFQIIIH